MKLVGIKKSHPSQSIIRKVLHQTDCAFEKRKTREFLPFLKPARRFAENGEYPTVI